MPRPVSGLLPRGGDARVLPVKDVQSPAELDDFWKKEDPWGYRVHPHDRIRVGELLAALPRRTYERVLDIGCGDGFLTFELPGNQVRGLDLSKEAIRWATERAKARPDAARFTFAAASIFDLGQLDLGTFDLIVITGVLYPQYIAGGFAAIEATIDGLLAPGGVLASVHIGDWYRVGFGLMRLSQHRYAYREYEHVLEVYQK
jgi:SAM-dependent methyltransferase